MPDFILIDKIEGNLAGFPYWFIYGYIGTFDSLSEALTKAEEIKARDGGIIANISGQRKQPGTWNNERND